MRHGSFPTVGALRMDGCGSAGEVHAFVTNVCESTWVLIDFLRELTKWVIAVVCGSLVGGLSWMAHDVNPRESNLLIFAWEQRPLHTAACL